MEEILFIEDGQINIEEDEQVDRLTSFPLCRRIELSSYLLLVVYFTESQTNVWLCVCVCVCVYIYIYILYLDGI